MTEFFSMCYYDTSEALRERRKPSESVARKITLQCSAPGMLVLWEWRAKTVASHLGP